MLKTVSRKDQDLILAILLCIIALIPRSFGLSNFLTADEDTMLSRSSRFLEAVASGKWQDVPSKDPRPAITTYWLGSLGMLGYYGTGISWNQAGLTVRGKSLSEVYRPSMELFAHTRYPGVLLTSCAIGALYLILRRILDRQTAWFASFLVSFDPYYMAHSRILGYHSLHATFAALSVSCLCVGLYTRKRKWLILCGIFAGLAWLSVFLASALFIVFLVVWIWDYASKRQRRIAGQLLANLVLLYGAVGLTVFVLWPSLWVQPLETARGVIEEAISHSNRSGVFFWGQNRTDPGFFFYPVVLLFRSTPIVLVGAAASLATIGPRLVGAKLHDGVSLCLRIFWVSFLGYFLVLSAATIKTERFFLPGFLALDIIAAIGWSSILRRLFPARSGSRGNMPLTWAMGLICGLTLATCLPYHPYYFSYYNPVLGGARVAVNVLPVGWGEGLEQAADYLNHQKDSQNLRVGVFYPQLFRDFFRGKVYSQKFPPTSEGRHRFWPLQLDYAVVYIGGLQRFKLPRSFSEVFREEDAEFVVRQNGIDYAWVYKISDDKFQTLPETAVPWNVQYTIGLNLVGYKTYPTDFDRLTGDYFVPLVLYWQTERSCSKEYYFDYELTDGTGKIWSSKQTLPYCADWSRDDAGLLVFPEDLNLVVQPLIPPGTYYLGISQRSSSDGEVVEPSGGAPVLPITIAKTVRFG